MELRYFNRPCGFRHILLKLLVNRSTSLYFPQHNIFILWRSGFLECLKVGSTWRHNSSKERRNLKGSNLSQPGAIINNNSRGAFNHDKPRPIFAELCISTGNSLKIGTWLAITEWGSSPNGESFRFSN